jgi:SAM-dependent methyltransferase
MVDVALSEHGSVSFLWLRCCPYLCRRCQARRGECQVRHRHALPLACVEGHYVCRPERLYAARATASKYVFTTDWVTPHERTWVETLTLFKGRPNVRALEIGSYEGRSAIWFLENILTDPSSSIITIDLFNGPFEQVFDRNVSGFKNQVTKIKAPSHEALRPLKPGSFDFIYVDGSHVAKDVFLDAALSWDLLKPGGVLIFDDYELKGPAGEPKPALDAFLNVFNPYVEVKHKGAQLIVKKR